MRWEVWLVLGFGTLSGLGMVGVLDRVGIHLTGDSVAYALYAERIWVSVAEVSPLWPPLYPALLEGVAHGFGLSHVGAAERIAGVSWGLFLGLAMLWVWRVGAGPVLGAAAVLLLGSVWAFLSVFPTAWTEGPFAALLLVHLCAVERILADRVPNPAPNQGPEDKESVDQGPGERGRVDQWPEGQGRVEQGRVDQGPSVGGWLGAWLGGRTPYWLMAGASASALSVLRYPGLVALIGFVGLALFAALFHPSPRRLVVRLGRACLAGVLVSTPLLAFMLRNALLFGGPFGLRKPARTGLFEVMGAVGTVSVDSLGWPLVLTLSGFGLVGLGWGRSGRNSLFGYTLALTTLLFGVVVVAQTRVAMDALGPRLLHGVWVLLWAVGLLGVGGWVRGLGSWKGRILSSVLGLWLGALAWTQGREAPVAWAGLLRGAAPGASPGQGGWESGSGPAEVRAALAETLAQCAAQDVAQTGENGQEAWAILIINPQTGGALGRALVEREGVAPWEGATVLEHRADRSVMRGAHGEVGVLVHPRLANLDDLERWLRRKAPAAPAVVLMGRRAARTLVVGGDTPPEETILFGVCTPRAPVGGLLAWTCPPELSHAARLGSRGPGSKIEVEAQVCQTQDG